MTNAKQTQQTSYDPNGTFVWYELRTRQPKQSITFFSEVLGWKTQAMNMGDFEYTMLLAGEIPVGGVVPTDAKDASFTSYLHVADVDAAAQRVAQAGGTVIGAPFDVPTVGRMVEVKDQDGAAFHLFKSAEESKAKARVAGTFHWNELWARDDKRAVSFLTSVVGFGVDAMPMPGMTYNVLTTKNGPVAGVMKSPAPNLAPAWLPYVHVENTDETVARAKRLGGTLEGEISEIPGVGRMAVLHAPDGARFAVIKPALDK
jgi:hypothetical protein